MLQKIEFARRQSLDAHKAALHCISNNVREEWLKAARMWDELADEYERILKINTREDLPRL
jgi:hypothetical protein